MANREYLKDSESMAALVEQMPPALRKEYKDYLYLHLESAFPGRVLVVYTVRDGKPDDIALVTFGSIEIHQQLPPQIKINYKGRGSLISPIPERLADREVFIHVPQNFVFRWAGQREDGNLNFRPHYAVLLKMRGKPDRNIEGYTYAMNLKSFNELHPGFQDQVRF